jgi:DNA-binding NarL/FixJ family response regulator
MSQLGEAADPAGPMAAALNERDRQVLLHLAGGRSTAGIASALSVTNNTARTRIRRVVRLLEVRDRAAAVVAAQDLGVLRRAHLRSRG